ncbi:hypothetical protein ABW19_dt0200800 [Dactylella cylindrospora]|nr:hypothetical protein ABW19_dt0200800 [Dactylella cylindrospora]
MGRYNQLPSQDLIGRRPGYTSYSSVISHIEGQEEKKKLIGRNLKTNKNQDAGRVNKILGENSSDFNQVFSLIDERIQSPSLSGILRLFIDLRYNLACVEAFRPDVTIVGSRQNAFFFSLERKRKERGRVIKSKIINRTC